MKNSIHADGFCSHNKSHQHEYGTQHKNPRSVTDQAGTCDYEVSQSHLTTVDVETTGALGHNARISSNKSENSLSIFTEVYRLNHLGERWQIVAARRFLVLRKAQTAPVECLE